MSYRATFRVEPGSRLRLEDCDPGRTDGDEGKKDAHSKNAVLQKRMGELQFRLYAEQKRSLLICLQASDAGGKDGVVRHVIGAMNPQGCRVVGFKQPSTLERAHDFLWRIEHETPKRGEVVIFNRSHYEDVLIVRVHDLTPKEVWSERYEQINAFERRLVANGTQILKFFLHISKEEQLERFKDRLDDPERHWKISDADYAERAYWSDYQEAYEAALGRCSTVQHRRRAVVHHPLGPQVVPQPRHLAHHRRDDGEPRYRGPGVDSEHRRHSQAVSRGACEGRERVKAMNLHGETIHGETMSTTSRTSRPSCCCGWTRTGAPRTI